MKIKRVIFFIPFFVSILSASDFIGKPAPEFNSIDINNKEIRLSDYRGKIVLLDFWATWCKPCQQEFPFLVKFYKDHKKDNFIVLAVNIDNKEENMRAFLSKHDATRVFPIIFDSDKTIPPLFELEVMPTSIFIDGNGIIRYVHNGFSDSSKKEFEQELETLLHKK